MPYTLVSGDNHIDLERAGTGILSRLFGNCRASAVRFGNHHRYGSAVRRFRATTA